MSNLYKGKRSGSSMQVWDLLTIGALILTVCIAGYFVLIYLNPNSSLNILPPGRSLFAAQPPTETPAPIKLQPTWTASPTLEMTATNTPHPTWTPYSTETPFSLVPPTRTPKPTSTPKAPFSAVSVTQVASTLIHPDFACNWAGIGGTVVDSNNSDVIGTVVVLRGLLDGKTVDLTTVTGINKEYGQSGYEFVLGNAPAASNKTLYVQLVDLNGIPLSDKVELTTSADCAKNLILVRFKKNR
jgi:hypothetical protein